MVLLPSNKSTTKRETYTEPMIDVKDWYVNICREWLSVYGYDSHGKINKLKARMIAIKKIVHKRKG